jgi:GNAT superfamily N-acetyltransferase
MSWLAPQRRKLNNKVIEYNNKLKPLGLSVVKNGTNGFIIKYQNGNKMSYIGVNTRPNTLTANLARGETHPNNRGKGIATALRTFATALLRNAGYVKVTHQGVNFEKRNNTSRRKTRNVPITTHIVREHIGFRPSTKNNSNFRSYWVPSGRYKNSMLKKLENAEQLSRLKLKALRK